MKRRSYEAIVGDHAPLFTPLAPGLEHVDAKYRVPFGKQDALRSELVRTHGLERVHGGIGKRGRE
jgi:hypothetical protein